MSTKFMVKTQLIPRGVKDPSVIRAVEKVSRELFVPDAFREFAYSDCPLPIGNGQTISQPYMVAAMTEYLEPRTDSRILEIGTGCGYQTAILAEIVSEVYTVEVVENLANAARTRLEALGYSNIRFKVGDGYYGWEEQAPYDGIIVTAAPDQFPHILGYQLSTGGLLVVPIGPRDGNQSLFVYKKQENGRFVGGAVMGVRFVPLTGDH